MAAVFTVFYSSPLPLNFVALQGKLAFLVAMASSRRPSEVASLRCSLAFMVINADSVHFLPSRLSKTDRPGHKGPPILIRHLPAYSGGDVSLCPIASLEEFLDFRRSLRIPHDFLFFFSSIFAFVNELLRWAFRRANIVAPPGSTCHVSDALACGAGVSDCLAAGDWTGVQTFFRH